MLEQITELINPLNHLVYQFVIILLVFIAIKKSHNLADTSFKRWSFIWLFATFAITIDWYMWCDMRKTLLFAMILTIYIYYNMQNEKTMAEFLDIVDTAKDETNQLTMTQQAEQYKIMVDAANKERVATEIENLTYNPPDINPLYLNRIEYVDTSKYKINPIDGAFETILPPNSMPDDYTNLALNSLYDSSQYKNILKSDIDKYLDNNIHYPQQQTQQEKWENYALLKNPKRDFFDSNWVHIKTPYYNDHCYSTGEENEFVKFGYKLENCTNQQNALLDSTMNQISTNVVPPMPILKDFTSNFAFQ